jgi:hypothetical protein
MAKELTTKSSKNELLDAYNELLEKIQGASITDVKTQREKEGREELVKTVATGSAGKIVKSLADLKISIASALDSVEDSLLNEFKNLTKLQEAIGIEDKNLENLYQIKVNVDSLAALLLAQKEKKQEFETELNERKELWEKEKKEYEIFRKEEDLQQKKQRQREEEEYNYNLKLQRKKDQDLYEAKKILQETELAEKKSKIEKELTEREQILAVKELEFKDLKVKVESFSKELEKAIAETEKTITEKIELKYKHQSDLLNKEIEGERKLNEQLIASLRAKIKEQETLVTQLTTKADTATQQVKDIAVKVVEGAANQKVILQQEKKGE